MKLGKRTLGAASCRLGHSSELPEHLRDIVELSEVWVEPWHRRKGIANRLMDKICEEADNTKTVLLIRVDDEEWLPKWYETHGFQKIQDAPLLMARAPYTIN